jgi:hypothetical protein
VAIDASSAAPMTSIISGENAASEKFFIGDLAAEEVQLHSFRVDNA